MNAFRRSFVKERFEDEELWIDQLECVRTLEERYKIKTTVSANRIILYR